MPSSSIPRATVTRLWPADEAGRRFVDLQLEDGSAMQAADPEQLLGPGDVARPFAVELEGERPPRVCAVARLPG